MVHDDLRVEWIRQRVSAGFNLPGCPDCFDELLSRQDGEEEEKIIRYLNVVSDEDSPSCLLFFKTIREEEVEVKGSAPYQTALHQGKRNKSQSLILVQHVQTLAELLPESVSYMVIFTLSASVHIPVRVTNNGMLPLHLHRQHHSLTRRR